MEPPKKLSSASKDVWNDIERLASRKLNKADYALIETLCCELDVYRRAVEEMEGRDIESERTKQLDPAVSARNQAATNIRQYYKLISKFIREEDSGSNLKSVKNF